MNNLELEQLVRSTFENLEGNNFSTLGSPEKPMWGTPLIGVASGSDPYFDFLKQHIGDFHWNPADAFSLKYGENPSTDPANLRVISMAFPQTMETKRTQLSQTDGPSRNWLVSRGEWEPLMKTFSRRLVATFESLGIRSVSIDLQPEFSVVKTGPLGIASRWSHRHYAYAAGLGTFGLSDGLITEKGKAVRFTSLIIEAPMEITQREYTGPYDWCLFHQDDSCGKCMDRCPCGAITLQGHDKNTCLDYEDYFEANLWPAGLDKKDYMIGCGLCQVGIPCQDKRP